MFSAQCVFGAAPVVLGVVLVLLFVVVRAFVWLCPVLGISPFCSFDWRSRPPSPSLPDSVLVPSSLSPVLLFSSVWPSLSFSVFCASIRSFSFSLSFASPLSFFFVSGDFGLILLLDAIVSSSFVVVAAESIGTDMVHFTADCSDLLDNEMLDNRSDLIGVFD